MIIKILKRKFWFLVVAILTISNLHAQCTITAPSYICLGNMGYFNVTTNGTIKIAMVKWDFGDGYTAKFKNTGHLYKKSGNYKVRCNITFVDSSNCADTVNISVLELPKSNFTITTSNSCLGLTPICIKNNSQGASTKQAILKSLVIWDDGAIESIDSLACHAYREAGDFKISLEITDVMGCKSISNKEINLISSPHARFNLNTKFDCGKTSLCIFNTSDTFSNLQTYIWNINGSSIQTSNYDSQFCYTFNKSQKTDIQLIVQSSNGCSDTLHQIHDIKVDSIINIKMTMSDTSVCWREKVYISVPNVEGYTYKWNYENNTTSAIEFDTRTKGKIGGNLIQCTVSKGKCIQTLKNNLQIKGPKAHISLFNNNQCGVSLKVFFIDSTVLSDPQKVSRLWQLEDAYGDSCISYRAKKINKSKNCNYSKDWFHKHYYTINANHKVKFWVFDSLTQCWDTTTKYVNTNNCNAPGDCLADTSVCPGDMLFRNLSSKIKAEKFSLDSGKTWHYFPWVVDKNLKGKYRVMVAYNIDSSYVSDYGDDSIKIYSDTSKSYFYEFINQTLEIKTGPDAEFKYTLSKECRFKELIILLKDSVVKAGERLKIDWGDKTSTEYWPMKDTVYKLIKHRYNLSALSDSISIYRILPNGCGNLIYKPIRFGYSAYFDSIPGICLGKEICYGFKVISYGDSIQWNESNNMDSVKLNTGENKWFINDYKPCYIYNSPGEKTATLITISKDGCSDTIQRKLLINSVEANITKASKYFGCGEIKQLFDSSYLLPKGSTTDKIVEYEWNFGKKNNRSIEKNPFHAFEKFGTFKVNHRVRTENGCWDTIEFTVNVKGPQANFKILDTIGCEPFTVKLKNMSRNSSQYYWDFGDPDQSTFLIDDTSDIEFSYTQAGKYYLRLTAIDTFYSSTTQTLYYCNDTFPLNLNSRSVTVLPYLHVNFNCEDTICNNEDLNISNLSDKRLKFIDWDFGDGTKKKLPNSPNSDYRYKSPGLYTITAKPDIESLSGNACYDTLKKEIFVLGTMASFSFERTCENSPLTQFVNTSFPDSNINQLLWNFGHLKSEHNQTSEQNPTHDFGLEIGNYQVCLRIKDTFGCIDSFCQLINVNYTPKLLIPNVFTPGIIDDKNDEFDIVMEGEVIYNLWIYNRWGLLMYHSNTDSERGTAGNWNGKVNNTGKICPEGTYFYIFEYKNCYGDNELKRITGSITLVR